MVTDHYMKVHLHSSPKLEPPSLLHSAPFQQCAAHRMQLVLNPVVGFRDISPGHTPYIPTVIHRIALVLRTEPVCKYLPICER